MLPNQNNNDNETGQERPSLPSIRDLFGEHLSKPVNNRPSPFFLADLSSSLPSGSSSPAYSTGSMLSSTMTSPRSAWSSQTSARNNPVGADSSYALISSHHSGSGSQFFTTPSTSSSQDDYLTLPPINPTYSHPYQDTGRRASSPYITTTPRPISNMHSRSRSISETEVARKFFGPDLSLEPSSKRRHTIGSSRSTASSARSSSVFSRNITHAYPSVTNPYSETSTLPSSTWNLPSAVNYCSPPSSSPPSPHSTSGDEFPTEKKKAPAKYECQYCKKRFNRPSSLKLHHNTHTGEKPFACPFPGCGRHFSVLSNMRRHARIHGQPSATAPPRDSSVEDNSEASTVNSSSSSTYNTPVMSSRLEMLRDPSRARVDTHEGSQSPSSDRGGSSSEW